MVNSQAGYCVRANEKKKMGQSCEEMPVLLGATWAVHCKGNKAMRQEISDQTWAKLVRNMSYLSGELL